MLTVLSDGLSDPSTLPLELGLSSLAKRSDSDSSASGFCESCMNLLLRGQTMSEVGGAGLQQPSVRTLLSICC